ncbi:hypothetical protein [Synechocystis sp. PCC 7509]|uniref:hypothetical protein n=1 Tax=Synechocystis sp. PCC 7509 TaxID=927677 RepID=UPI0002AC703C|nr:hypothetical protein [Synechocystis sp. PCC 7509]
MNYKNNFQPLQIVCLEHLATCLYAEVIQVVESRQMCWVRPMLLVSVTDIEPSVLDLRSTVDLLWSLASFRPALDTEILPFLANIFTSTPPLQSNNYARQQLNYFVQQLWQAQKSELQNNTIAD